MKTSVALPVRLSLSVSMALAALLAISLWQSSCAKPALTQHVYPCTDRKIDVNAGAATGVDQDTVVVCGGQKLDWKEKHNEDWEVEFTVSPFEQSEKKIKKGGGPHSNVKHLADDTAFKYWITVDGTKHDPQIIIMGGT
jgi:hypothetical protein